METPSRELRLLTNALRQPIFRFIVIGHNRKHIIDDIADHLKATYPNRPFLTLRLNGKAYRDIIDTLNTFREGIVLIPDFDWLFRPGNEDLCTAFNQRRDALARLPLALLCFVEPSGYTNVPKRIPDWWSLRSLALEFHSDETDLTETFLETDTDVSSLGGQTKAEKEAEIERLQKQLRLADIDNRVLLLYLNQQIGNLYYQLSQFSEALPYLEQSLKLARQIGDRAGEGTTLNNISQIYDAKGDYETALHYLEQSLSIRQQIGDRAGEGTTLNNISQIYDAKGDYETALHYLEQSLSIQQQIGDRAGEGATLNNISQIYTVKGDYETALHYLEQSLSIQQQIGDRKGEGTTLNNISQIYDAKGDYETALHYLEQSLSIRQQIGDRAGEGTTLNNISQIYDAKGDYETALHYLEQSLSIQQQIGDRAGEGATLNNISQIYDAKGDYETALHYLEQSLSIQQQIGDRKGEATVLHNLGAIYYEQFADVQKAVPLLEKSRSLFTQIGSPSVKNSVGYLSAIIEQIGEERFNQIVQSIDNKPQS
ncbi:tetratricopeptide repeat protein [Fibrisoma montanum]|uniref:Tetratricopeptide repeat protein n=1 Tax=Fibrisoma montanum TaxID=2305895 RepID=A0A418M5S4_9BACT|nr:tetratricopeptide repeat protein [Fibrisoma montanum]RIV21204.1 tetratricopeptide repeat protein [Fibrisoma montanum]